MNTAGIRFYAELNSLLPEDKRQREFDCVFASGTSVKHLVETLGVPHTEIDLILVNSVSVDFSYQPQDGDHISVYPVFESLDISPLIHLRPEPLRVTRFVLDTHLGRLAAYLRLLGFDTLYRNDYGDAELADISCEKQRLLLTRDRGLLKRKAVTHGYCVRENDPHVQVLEVLRRFQLRAQVKPFQRCLKCNGLLQAVDKESIQERLRPGTQKYYDQFFICADCSQVFWKGSHYQHMKKLVDAVINNLEVTD